MNFVEQWQHDYPDGRWKLIACPHLSLPDAQYDPGTRLIPLIDNAVDGATTLVLCGVCANTVVGAMVDEVVQRTVKALWSSPAQVAVTSAPYETFPNAIVADPSGLARISSDQIPHGLPSMSRDIAAMIERGGETREQNDTRK